MNPEVAALLEELSATPEKVSVTFFPMGIHSHLMSDGQGGWNLEVHSTVQFPWEDEEVITKEEHLRTDELVARMGMMVLIAEDYMSKQVAAQTQNLDAELEALLRGE